jgi:hypothetical protein
MCAPTGRSVRLPAITGHGLVAQWQGHEMHGRNLSTMQFALQVDVEHRELSAEEQALHKQRIGALYGFDMKEAS